MKYKATKERQKTDKQIAEGCQGFEDAGMNLFFWKVTSGQCNKCSHCATWKNLTPDARSYICGVRYMEGA